MAAGAIAAGIASSLAATSAATAASNAAMCAATSARSSAGPKEIPAAPFTVQIQTEASPMPAANTLPHPVMMGTYEEIAKALPDSRSIVLVAGEADASDLIDVICEKRGFPVDLQCRIQIIRSVAETVGLLTEQGIGVSTFATEAARTYVLGKAFVQHGNIVVGPVEAIDRMADLIPDAGAILIADRQERKDLLGARVIARRGNNIAARCLFLVSKSYEQEAKDLEGVWGTFLYDPAFPTDRIRSRPSLVDRYRTGRFAAPSTQAERIFGGKRVDPTPPPVRIDLTAEEIAIQQEQGLARYAGKVRKAHRTADRAASKATWEAFVRMLPLRPHRILISELQQAAYVMEWVKRLNRQAELEAFLTFRVLPINGQQIPKTVDGVEAYAAPGLTVSLGRAMVRNEFGRLRAAVDSATRGMAIADEQNDKALAMIQDAARRSEEALRAEFSREEERLRSEIVRLDGENNLLRLKVRDLQAAAAPGTPATIVVGAPPGTSGVVPKTAVVGAAPGTAGVVPAAGYTGYPFGSMTFVADPAPHAAAPAFVGADGGVGTAVVISDPLEDQAGSLFRDLVDPATPRVIVISRMHPDDSSEGLVARPAPNTTVSASELSDAFSAAAQTLGPYSKGRNRC